MNEVAQLRSDPHSVEAEQQLLGAILTNNENAHEVSAILSEADFYEPTHQRIFAAAMAKIERDEIASPVTLKAAMAADEGLSALGGPRYLARLAGASISSFAVKDYAKLIRDAAARREALAFLAEAQRAISAGAERTADIMGRLEAAIVEMRPADTKYAPTSFLKAVSGAIKQVDDAYHGRPMPSIAPPWGPLRDIIPSFRAGDMVVLAGRPSMGKTAVGLSIATAAAKAGHPVVIASFEMSPEDMVLRAISEGTSEAGNAVPYLGMTNGDIHEGQYRQTVETIRTMRDLPIQFLSVDFRRPGTLIAGVKSALRKMGDMGGKTPLLMVDYLQLMDGDGRTITEQVSKLSQVMKYLAMSQNAVNLTLSQLSRNVETRDDKRPKLSDLRESGQIEQDADTVIFCYREEYYLEREMPSATDSDRFAAWEASVEAARGRLDLIVGKQRRGPIGTARLRCALAFNRIWEG